MPLAAAGAIDTAESWGTAWGAVPGAAELPESSSAAPRCGEGGKQPGFSTLPLGSFPFCWDRRELCRPLPPFSLLRCGAGSSPFLRLLLQSPLSSAVTPANLFLFSTCRLGIQQQVSLGGYRTVDQQSPVEGFAFFLQRCFSAHSGKNPCASMGTSPKEGL